MPGWLQENFGFLSGATGGWAGGEKAIKQIQSEVGEWQPPVVKAQISDPYATEDSGPLPGKDYGNMVGGWAGGERGVKQFAADGKNTTLEQQVCQERHRRKGAILRHWQAVVRDGKGRV
mgnify:FL=1